MLICSWTVSRSLTEPARLSSACSWVMAACAEVTRLPTSATCWVTSWACWVSEVWVPSTADSVASVVSYAATGTFSRRLTVERA